MSGEIDITNLPPGTNFGNYRLAGKLGQGGMGTVYLAEQTSIGRQVALKVLHPERLNSERGLERFLHEARTAAALQHRNLVTIHEVGYLKRHGIAFYSMDYIHGRNLYTIVNQEGPLAPDRARSYVLQVCQAVGYAHQNGMIHRDIKPENILIDEYDLPQLADLGLVANRIGGGGNGPRNPRALSIIGTPTWSAPEQLRHPDRCTAATDVFSLGALYYYLLTAQRPFDGDSLIDLAVNVCTEDPPLLADLAATEAAVIGNLMAKDPEDRPPGGREAALLIEQPEQALAAAAGRGDRPTTHRRRRVRRRH